MDVTKYIICELTCYKPVTVDVSQGDRGSRAVSCRLLENGAPWMIPEGATARVAYTLPDGTEGLYDALPDGSPAGEIAGNTVTVELADQIMDQAGMAQVSILVLGPEGGQLATWPIRVMVMANKAARLTVPENLPPYGAGFAGKLFYGGADGTLTPLGLGAGVRVEMMANGAMVLVGEGGGPSEDILTELRALADRVNAALNSDDATLDQLSEIVAYIKSNKTLIDAITTSKVSVSDIVNNLTTNVANKPLSAAQGVVLKTLIDELRQTVGQGGGTGDGAVRSVNGKTGDVTLTATDVGAMSESGANAIIINLLDEAKKSGEFDGAPGDDYVLTDADRQEIAEIAEGLVEVPNVKPVAKTEDMTQPVGVDDEGRLWSAPLTVNIPGGTWELIGEITSDGAGNSGGIYVPIDFTQYKEIHVEAVDTIDGELMYRLKYSNKTEWYSGEILTKVKRAEIVMHSVHTFNVSGGLKNIVGYASGYSGGSDIFINNSPRNLMLASDFKFICLDANGTVVPEGATLKVWGCK